MKSANKFLKQFTLVPGLFLAAKLSAAPGVCEYDCRAHAKTRYACGVKITWKSQSVKMCESINYPQMWACESARTVACKIGGAFEESGPDGPMQHYEKFQLLPYTKLFDVSSDNAVRNVQLLQRTIDYFSVQSLNAEGMQAAFKAAKGVSDNAETIARQLQEFSNWSKWAGIVCPKDDYEKLKNHMPFYYLKQIPAAKFCKMRWQHLSNNWANGFQRNRTRLECESTWGLQGFERQPLTFTCANRNGQMEALKKQVEEQTAGDLQAFAGDGVVSLEAFLKGVNWQETEEVKKARLEVSSAEEELFTAQTQRTMFEAQLSEVDSKIAAEDSYQKQLTEKLGRILGFIESYQGFIQIESEKIKDLESKFGDQVAQVKASSTLQSENAALLGEYLASLHEDASGTRLSADYLAEMESQHAELSRATYKDLCESNSLRDSISRLQRIQAYRLDLVDRMTASLTYFEDSTEFAETKKIFERQADDLEKKVSAGNFIYGKNFESLKSRHQVCKRWEKSRRVLDALKHELDQGSDADSMATIRERFEKRWAALDAEGRVLEQKASLRNQVYSLMKNLEDNFNAGYLTQLLRDSREAKAKMEASSRSIELLYPEAEAKPLMDEIASKLSYLAQREDAYRNPVLLRNKLQNRLNRLVSAIADYRDEGGNDRSLLALRSDVEMFLNPVFNYNAERVTALIPATQDLAELSNYDSILTDVEEKFATIKELSR